MNDADRKYQEMRDIWDDYNRRQEFEHTLIDRKTTWLLTTQALLFAAYGVTLDSKSTADGFRSVVAGLGVTVAAIVLLGVVCLINSKHLSWQRYCAFFSEQESPNLLRPLGIWLEWGVRTRNTWVSLGPDVMLPCAFIGAWCAVLFWV